MKQIFLILAIAGLTSLHSFSQKTSFTPRDVLNVKSLSISDINDDGSLIIGSIRSRRDRLNIDHSRYGDPNYVSPSKSKVVLINTESGNEVTILPEGSIVGRVKLSPSGNELAYIIYQDNDFKLYIYNISSSKSRQIKIKSDLKISSNSGLDWTNNGKELIIGLREKGWSEKGDSLFKEATAGPITVYDSKRPFLKWDEIRNYSSLSLLAKIDIKSGSVERLLPEGRYSGLVLPEQDNKLVYTEVIPKKTVYDRSGGTEYGLYSLDMDNPAMVDTIIEQGEKRIRLNWNEAKNSYAYADSNQIYIRKLEEEKAIKISSDTMEIVKDDTSKARFSFVMWRPDDKAILASSEKGYWEIDISTREMDLVYEFQEEKDKAPDLRILHWSQEDSLWYMSYSAKDKWERGIVKYNLSDKSFTDLVKDSNLYSRFHVTKDGGKFFYNLSDGNEPNELYMASPDFDKLKQISNLNPWIKKRKLTRSELIKYRDSDGKELYGVLYYPVDYEEGKKYPLVCEIYETFFNNGYSYSMNLIANAGFFGFKPSVNLIEGYPGEAWIKGITSGINKLIEEGKVDEDKLGVHGTSYGGYATSLLITQTDRFAAAINISGKVDIISFLGDSPRIGTRNYAAAEVGQDRIGESLWDAPMKYWATSAVMFADRIKTPHLLLTGEGDWNVPALNTRELYYAMRRLGKEVVWVNYTNGGHGAGNASNEADFYDHWKRILEWYETHFEKDKKDK